MNARTMFAAFTTRRVARRRALRATLRCQALRDVTAQPELRKAFRARIIHVCACARIAQRKAKALWQPKQPTQPACLFEQVLAKGKGNQ